MYLYAHILGIISIGNQCNASIGPQRNVMTGWEIKQVCFDPSFRMRGSAEEYLVILVNRIYQIYIHTYIRLVYVHTSRFPKVNLVHPIISSHVPRPSRPRKSDITIVVEYCTIISKLIGF